MSFPSSGAFFCLYLCQILLVAARNLHQFLRANKWESELNIIRMKRDFDPEDIHELGVAFENCCAAIPDTKSQQFREQLALKLINWASFGEVDGTKLYVRALETYRALQRL